MTHGLHGVGSTGQVTSCGAIGKGAKVILTSSLSCKSLLQSEAGQSDTLMTSPVHDLIETVHLCN